MVKGFKLGIESKELKAAAGQEEGKESEENKQIINIDMRKNIKKNPLEKHKV